MPAIRARIAVRTPTVALFGNGKEEVRVLEVDVCVRKAPHGLHQEVVRELKTHLEDRRHDDGTLVALELAGEHAELAQDVESLRMRLRALIEAVRLGRIRPRFCRRQPERRREQKTHYSPLPKKRHVSPQAKKRPPSSSLGQYRKPEARRPVFRPERNVVTRRDRSFRVGRRRRTGPAR